MQPPPRRAGTGPTLGTRMATYVALTSGVLYNFWSETTSLRGEMLR